jgi:hypothetical protein
VSYSDCTKDKTPDGTLANREWCFIEDYHTGVSGKRSWDYCAAYLDFNKIREYSLELRKKYSDEVFKTTARIATNIKPAENVTVKLALAKQAHIELNKNINGLFSKIRDIGMTVMKLYKSKETWEVQEKLTGEFSLKLDDRLKLLTGSCKGMPLYDDEEFGDGITGYFYNNELWQGEYIKTAKFEHINFNWNESSPLPGVNFLNFSVLWKGYIHVPYTSDYRFHIESSSGAELKVNNKIIISYLMSSILDDEPTVGLISNDEIRQIISSEFLRLRGGSRVRVELKYYYSVHNYMENFNENIFRLFWSSEKINRQIIPGQYFYTSNDFAPLKIKDFNSKEIEISRLINGISPFLDSKDYILQDIPAKYMNLKMLKFKQKYLNEEINFNVNNPVYIYIGLLNTEVLSDKEFEYVGEFFSLIPVINQKQTRNKKSFLFKIFKKRFQPGSVKIKLNSTKGISVIIFFLFDNSQLKPIQCDNKDIEITSLNQIFQSCLTSSFREEFSCENGLNGHMRDEQGSIWSSYNEGPGAWLLLTLKQSVRLTKLIFKNRHNQLERNKEIELEFDNDYKQIFSLRNTDDKETFIINDIPTKQVKVTVKDSYGSLNNGGAFLFYGSVCDEELINPSLQQVGNVNSLIALTCYDTLTNNNKFEDILNNKTLYKDVLIKCPEACFDKAQPIYGGNLIYSADSLICKSAYHADVISLKGGSVKVKIRTDNDVDFISVTNNGISSSSRLAIKHSFSFEKVELENNTNLLK